MSADVSDTFSSTTIADAGDDTSPITDPAWLDDVEDYLGTKLGIDYNNTDYTTNLPDGNPIVCDTSAELAAALTAARSDPSITSIHLEAGTVFSWPSNGLVNINRPMNAPLTIRTISNGTPEAQISNMYESQGCSGVAFVNLDLSNGINFINVGSRLLFERCKGWLSIQGQNLGNNRGSRARRCARD